MKEKLLRIVRALLPEDAYRRLLATYHLWLAYLGAFFYGYPSRKLFVIAVTGTKGKSSTVEIIRAMLREAGYKTAAASTIQFCIGDQCEPNLYKMTMVGRFFLQKFLRQAVDEGASHAVIEMTSEGAAQFRHKAIELDALVFTNLAPEHLESHGGMERYAAAKLSIAEHLAQSPKRPRIIVANADDAYGAQFLATQVEVRAPFSLADAAPYTADENGARFFWRGQLWNAPLPGVFSLKNILAALALGEALGLPQETMRRALEKTSVIAGRAQRIERGQSFTVIVDYAHTPDSLRALYETFGTSTAALVAAAPAPHRKKAKSPADAGEKNAARSKRRICVLGSTGGGRDTWKRPAMGAIADEFCDLAFITDEDPYDEDPRQIIDAIAQGFSRVTPRIIMDRREAMAAAFREARAGDVVLITGKGTDPYIMRAGGTREPWSDKRVAEEELDVLLTTKA